MPKTARGGERSKIRRHKRLKFVEKYHHRDGLETKTWEISNLKLKEERKQEMKERSRKSPAVHACACMCGLFARVRSIHTVPVSTASVRKKNKNENAEKFSYILLFHQHSRFFFFELWSSIKPVSIQPSSAELSIFSCCGAVSGSISSCNTSIELLYPKF